MGDIRRSTKTTSVILLEMSNIVVPVLSVTIGLFFVLVGTIKLTPFISEEFYKEMVCFLSFSCQSKVKEVFDEGAGSSLHTL